MNQDINKTLSALVPIFRMNGVKVKSIEAVRSWYKAPDQLEFYKTGKKRIREYCKEVAEITFDNGRRTYADIGCDSNLTACFDVLAVIQEIKKKSDAIERIERGIYPQADDETRSEQEPGEWKQIHEQVWECPSCGKRAHFYRTNYCAKCGRRLLKG